MMNSKKELMEALALLGEVLDHRGEVFDVAVVGGAALLLQDLISRPTLDLDAIAIVKDGKWTGSKPLPKALVAAVRNVARTLDLPHEPRDEKDWLNPGPTMLLKMRLPSGFEQRATILRFGGLTLRTAAREDLVCLKLWAATDTKRGVRRKVDVDDLRALRPTAVELRTALNWCREKDGRPDFIAVDAAPVLQQLGFDARELIDE